MMTNILTEHRTLQLLGSILQMPTYSIYGAFINYLPTGGPVHLG